MKIQDCREVDSPNIAIIVQGLFAAWNNPTSIAVRDAIVERRLASTILYDSDRDWEALKTAGTREEWRAAFKGKTYEKELEELREVVRHANEKYSSKNLFLVARSYGASLAVLLSGEGIENLRKVVVAGPEIQREGTNLPSIYQGFPDKLKILEAAARFKGEFTIVQGIYDQLTPIRNSLDLLHATQKGTMAVLKQEHSPIITKENDKPYVAPEYIKAHINALS